MVGRRFITNIIKAERFYTKLLLPVQEVTTPKCSGLLQTLCLTQVPITTQLHSSISVYETYR